MYVLGIDPGLNGALCIIEKEGIVDTMLMPTCKRPNSKGNWIDLEKVYNFITKYNDRSEYSNKWITDIYIERQFILRSQGMSSGSKTMYQAGCLYGMCYAECDNLFEINAKDWQKSIFKKVDENNITQYNYNNDTKLKSIAYVEQVYGRQHLFYSKRQTKPSDGLADAICIASYGLSLTT
jgi:tetrahydromethanopterin S-methyltransferase subunit F